MKILIISYFFPPFNRIGSLRMGKMAKYLQQFGHEIRVITNNHRSEDRSAPVEIPSEHLIHTDAVTFEQTIESDYYEKSLPGKTLFRLYSAISYKKRSFMLPDSSWAWYGEGIGKANELLKIWQPDLIYSSALPISSHFIARKISVRHNIPWVAEYRDLWSGGHGARVSSTRSLFLKKIEKWLLKPVKALVTVSAPLASYLEQLHKKQTEIVYNGYDERPAREASKVSTKDHGAFTIVYTGSIYEGRDPEILFKALKLLKFDSSKINVHFYTKPSDKLQSLILEYDLKNIVKIKDLVPYEKSLKIQSEADALLFLSYSSTQNQGKGILSGKVFEYLAADRPILSVGLDRDHLFIKQGLMIHFENPIKLANRLEKWLDEKEKKGHIEYKTNEKMIKNFSRKEQTKKVNTLINKVLNDV